MVYLIQVKVIKIFYAGAGDYNNLAGYYGSGYVPVAGCYNNKYVPIGGSSKSRKRKPRSDRGKKRQPSTWIKMVRLCRRNMVLVIVKH